MVTSMGRAGSPLQVSRSRLQNYNQKGRIFTLCQGYLLVIISVSPLMQTVPLNLKKMSHWRITPIFVKTYLLTE